ncbi:MAG: DUF2889 domain-containing protein [Pseudomonadota bacterium]
MAALIEREELHHRQVDLRFYRRSDGLYEVTGKLLDRKTQPFMRQLAAEPTPPGTPVHDISVYLVLDEDLVVQDAGAVMDTTPYDVCRGATATLAPLKGLQIGAGWNRKVRDVLGGAASCTHIAELLGPMATTAFQGLAPKRLAVINLPGHEKQRQAKVNSCFAYAAHRSVVARLWPELHEPL